MKDSIITTCLQTDDNSVSRSKLQGLLTLCLVHSPFNQPLSGENDRAVRTMNSDTLTLTHCKIYI